MPIKFHCLSCGRKLAVADSLAGRRAKCPECGGAVQIPQASPPAPPPSVRPARQEPTRHDLRLDSQHAADSPPQPIPATASAGSCPSCGTRQKGGGEFCAECGASIRIGRPTACPACAGDVAAGAKFCPTCGVLMRPSDRAVGDEVAPANKRRGAGTGAKGLPTLAAKDIPESLAKYVARDEGVLHVSGVHWMVLVYALVGLAIHVSVWFASRKDVAGMGFPGFGLLLFSVIPFYVSMRFVFGPGAGLVALLCAVTAPFGPILSLLMVALLALVMWTTCYAVTTRRIIELKTIAFLFRVAREVGRGKVESLDVHQYLAALQFGYGTVVVTGSGGSPLKLLYVARALQFREAFTASADAGGA